MPIYISALSVGLLLSPGNVSSNIAGCGFLDHFSQPAYHQPQPAQSVAQLEVEYFHRGSGRIDLPECG